MDLLLGATHRVETRHFWFRGLRRFLRPFLAQAAAGRASVRLLDCGCGTGGNLSLLARFGSVCAIDPSAFGASLARDAGCARVARATAAQLPFPDATFDVVASIDVLYCLPDVAERCAVDEIYRVLKPGGALVLNVAAMRILRGSHSVLAGEARRYDRAGLRALLGRAGFRIERITYTNASLFPLVLAQRAFQRAAGLSSREHAARQMTLPPEPVNALLNAVLAVEAAVLRVTPLPFGSSLLCLARKDSRRAAAAALR